MHKSIKRPLHLIKTLYTILKMCFKINMGTMCLISITTKHKKCSFSVSCISFIKAPLCALNQHKVLFQKIKQPEFILALKTLSLSRKVNFLCFSTLSPLHIYSVQVPSTNLHDEMFKVTSCFCPKWHSLSEYMSSVILAQCDTAEIKTKLIN